jgi:signal transduction histidine kinase
MNVLRRSKDRGDPGDHAGHAYTPAGMGDGSEEGRRGPDVTALYAEAESLLSQSANELRAITERLREAIAAGNLSPADGHGAPDELSEIRRARSLLTRLELTTHGIEDDWRFLERGVVGQWSDDGRGLADQPSFTGTDGLRIAKRILEVQELERARLAEEIHDGPAQALANAVFGLELAKRHLDVDPEAARSELERMQARLERELERMRAFIHELRPAIDAEDGLAQALAESAERLTTDAGMEVTLELAAPEAELDPDRRTAVLRVAQEAMRNAGKHSGARRVVVTTRLEPAGLSDLATWVLEVQDDGSGFAIDEALEQSPRRHFGLRFMRERAQLVNARLEITSDGRAGTTVRLCLEPVEGSRQG